MLASFVRMLFFLSVSFVGFFSPFLGLFCSSFQRDKSDSLIQAFLVGMLFVLTGSFRVNSGSFVARQEEGGLQCRVTCRKCE